MLPASLSIGITTQRRRPRDARITSHLDTGAAGALLLGVFWTHDDMKRSMSPCRFCHVCLLSTPWSCMAVIMFRIATTNSPRKARSSGSGVNLLQTAKILHCRGSKNALRCPLNLATPGPNAPPTFKTQGDLARTENQCAFFTASPKSLIRSRFGPDSTLFHAIP